MRKALRALGYEDGSVFGRTHHLGITDVDGIVGVAFIGEFALEPTDQLPGRVEILFHIIEFGCGRCLGSHLDHRRGQCGRRLFSAGTDETFREGRALYATKRAVNRGADAAGFRTEINARLDHGGDLDSRSLPGVYVAVVMGRQAGFLTAASAAARTG